MLGGPIVAQAAAACGLGGAGRRAAELWLSPALVGGQPQVPSGPSAAPAGCFGLCMGLLGSGQPSQDLFISCK